MTNLRLSGRLACEGLLEEAYEVVGERRGYEEPVNGHLEGFGIDVGLREQVRECRGALGRPLDGGLCDVAANDFLEEA